MNASISLDLADARLAATLAFLDAGAQPARIRLYATPRRASVTDAPGAAPIVEVALAKPAGTVNAGVLTLAVSGEATVSVSGTPVWGCVVNGADVTAYDGDVTAVGGGGAFELPVANLYAGGLVRMSVGDLT